MKSTVLFSLVTFAFGQKCGVPPANYIFGGENATALEFPWQISLQVMISGEWQHRCGGSLIDKQWILTAAHCVEPRFGGNGSLRIVIGEHNLKIREGTESYHNISRSHDVFTHERWNSAESIDYDYALIKLSKALNFNGEHSHIRPICLPEQSDFSKFDHMTCTATGWGYTTLDKLQPSDVLKKVQYRVTPFRECAKEWAPSKITPRHICAYSTQGEGHGLCAADSGGPLQCRMQDGSWTLVGSASFIKYCGSGRYPTVFARTSQELLWIYLVKRKEDK